MIPVLFAGLLLAQAALPALSLDEALSRARTHNADLRAATARLDQARTISRKVWSNLLPQLSVGGSYTYNNVEAKISMPTGYAIRKVCDGTDPTCFMPQMPAGAAAEPSSPLPGSQTPYFMVPTGLATATIQKHDQVGAQLALNQAIFAPQLFPAIRQSYLAQEFAELTVDNARREVLFAVALLYYGAVGAKEALGVQEKLLESNIAHEKDAKNRVDAGVAPKVVLLRAQIDRTKSEADVRRARNAYDSTRSALSALLDRDTAFDVTMPPEPPVPEDLSKLSGDADSRPDVLAAGKNLEIAESGRTAGRLAYLPTIGAQAAARASNVAGFAGSNYTWLASVGLNWTIWDGGLREANLRENAAKVVEAEALVRSAKLKAQDDVRRAVLDFQSAQANKLKAEETVKLARESRQLVEVGFNAGTSTYVEVSDANAALAGAEMGRVAETLNSHLSVLRLAKASGAFDPR